MLRKGTVDLLLVKPMSRITLLLFKFIGGLTFIFLTTAFIVSGLWLVLGSAPASGRRGSSTASSC
jgi:ABC-type transport system involved in multi-copper enzyme maturation permease subunit